MFSISDCWSPWSDFNAVNNRRDFYCENTCLATWPEVTFWPGGRDVWPLHFDSGTFIQQEGVRGWTTFERSWLADQRLRLWTGGRSFSLVLTRVLRSGSCWSPRNPRSWASIVCSHFFPLNIVKLNSRPLEPDVHHQPRAQSQFLL